MNSTTHIPFISIKNAIVAYENELQGSYVSKLLQRLGATHIYSTPDSGAVFEQIRTTSFDLLVASARLPGASILQLVDALTQIRYSGHMIVSGLTDMRIQSAIYEYARQHASSSMQVIFAGEPLRLFDFTDMLYRAATPITADANGQVIEDPAPLIGANEVFRAYRAGEIAAFFQPSYYLTTGTMVGAEALVRWHHPTLGIISPDRFLTNLQECDLGWELIDQFIDTVASVSQSLTATHPLKLSINISSRDIASATWADNIVQRLKHSGGSSNQFAIEVTESGSTNNNDTIIAGAVAHWRLNGIDCVIDDFGTGAFSLNRLCTAPFNLLKIDRRMVWRSRLTRHVFDMLEAIVQLAHGLGMRVIATGIETEEDLMRMRSIKCDIGQGYYFSRPLPITQFQDLANSQQNIFGRSTSKAH